MRFLIWDFLDIITCYLDLDREGDAPTRGAALDSLIDVCKW
jgi:hypothetical protein